MTTLAPQRLPRDKRAAQNENTIDLDNDAATALATIIRRLTDAYGVDVQAWYRALDALSPQLPAAIETPKTKPPAMYPGEPGSLADVGRRRFILDEIESRARIHPHPNAAELSYRQRLADELAGA